MRRVKNAVWLDLIALSHSDRTVIARSPFTPSTEPEITNGKQGGKVLRFGRRWVLLA